MLQFSFITNLIVVFLGCGKSTQVPQYLLKAGYDKICCTQPRRIACISLRNRLSEETMGKYDTEIGFQIRFEKLRSKYTKVIFLTEGLLLRQMIEDTLLSNYNVIILDEIHERHLSCDFLLGAIKCILNRRNADLKLILMSATANCEMFSSFFGNCPIIKVPGRLFPIKTEYFPIEKFNLLKTNSSKINPQPYLKILQLIDEKHQPQERGDVLIFLSGYLEITTVGDALKVYADQTEKWAILYLHSSLSISDQDKVFHVAPEGVRKCILSTNIAETSLTIDGIRFVVDSGKVKEMHYDPKIRMHKLQEIWVSKASAEQRKGRAGRTGPGVCFRMYSQRDYDAFPIHPTSEIMRVSLESLTLNMISMGLTDVRRFPFIEPPDLSCLEHNLHCLIDCGALDSSEQITVLGTILSKLPLDIAIGKMLILSLGYNLVQYLLSAAACLSTQSLVTSQSMNDMDAIQERKPMYSLDGDVFTYINYYSEWLKQRGDDSGSTRRWCKKLGLEEQRFYEITKLRNQFKQIMTDSNLLQSGLPSTSGTSSSTAPLSKMERIKKHGEVKLYKQLKREHEKNHKSRKLKVLDTRSHGFGDDDDEDDGESARANRSEFMLKDVEFKLIFNERQLAEIKQNHSINRQQAEYIKYIVCMSFYPQVAIADKDNSYRAEVDQMFHTKVSYLEFD